MAAVKVEGWRRRGQLGKQGGRQPSSQPSSQGGHRAIITQVAADKQRLFRAFGTRNTHEFADVLHDVPSMDACNTGLFSSLLFSSLLVPSVPFFSLLFPSLLFSLLSFLFSFSSLFLSWPIGFSPTSLFPFLLLWSIWTFVARTVAAAARHTIRQSFLRILMCKSLPATRNWTHFFR